MFVACQRRWGKHAIEHIALPLATSDRPGTGQPSPPDPFVGTWRLVSWEQRSAEGEVTCPYGRRPRGLIVYTPNGQMSAQLMNPDGNLAGATASGAREIIGRMSENYFAYYGTYTVDRAAKTITHHVQGSLAPSWVGTDQIRQFEFLGSDRLRLTADISERDRFGDVATGRQILVWERID